MIVWLASYPKSGNTWLRKFLQAYMQDGSCALNQTHPRFRGDLRESDYQLVSAAPLTRMGFEGQLAYRHAALYNMMHRQPGRLYLKTHHSLTSQYGVELIPAYMSEGAVYVARDPRDVAISYAHHYGMGLDWAIHCMGHPKNTIIDPQNRFLFHGLGDWAGHVRLWTERDVKIPRYVVQFEKMVADPADVFRRVLRFLGHTVDETRLAKAVEATRFKAMQAAEDEEGFAETSSHARRFFRKGQPGEWRDVLTQAQAARIREQHGEQMDKLGYA